LVITHVAKQRYADAFKEHTQLVKCAHNTFVQRAGVLTVLFVSLFLRFFTNNSGWTLPALFATLRDLRDLAFDVSILPVFQPRG
jgi:COP9 signalosome complex subunit 12